MYGSRGVLDRMLVCVTECLCAVLLVIQKLTFTSVCCTENNQLYHVLLQFAFRDTSIVPLLRSCPSVATSTTHQQLQHVLNA
jgi:hypothetical protein